MIVGSPSLASVTCASFASLIGQEVEVAFESGGAIEMTLKLAECTPLGPVGPGMREPFSILLDGPPSPAVSQGTLWLRHQEWDELGVFVVAISGNDNGRRYEAIFN